MATTLIVLTSGLMAALIMAIVGFFLQFLGVHRADMITAVGSIFTRHPRKALGVGWFTHLLLGGIFAFAYAFVWSYFDALSAPGFILLGAVTGFLHGLVVSIMLVIEIAEHHPDPQFRKIGFTIALSYIGTHVVYGLALGYILGSFEMNYETISHIAAFRQRLGSG